MRVLAVFVVALSLAACEKSTDGVGSASPTAPAANSASTQPDANALPADALQQLDRYTMQARELITSIDAKAPTDEIQAHAEEMIATSEAVLPAFLERRPHCSAYLNAAVALKNSWTTMTSEQIEAGYHKDGAMPKIENAAACYHMKDMIVHPITALALLKESPDNTRKAKHEIEEVIAHVTVVKAMR